MTTTYHGDQSRVTFLSRCRQLRRSSTDAERLLWRLLRNRQVAEAKFRRQHQYGPYVLDFYCHEHKLAVEADGGQHTSPDGMARDAVRTRYLESRGIRVLRFTNLEILRETEAVIARIWEALTPALSQGERGKALTAAHSHEERGKALTAAHSHEERGKALTPALSQEERESQRERERR